MFPTPAFFQVIITTSAEPRYQPDLQKKKLLLVKLSEKAKQSEKAGYGSGGFPVRAAPRRQDSTGPPHSPPGIRPPRKDLSSCGMTAERIGAVGGGIRARRTVRTLGGAGWGSPAGVVEAGGWHGIGRLQRAELHARQPPTGGFSGLRIRRVDVLVRRGARNRPCRGVSHYGKGKGKGNYRRRIRV
jgi:hypothetical protein